MLAKGVFISVFSAPLLDFMKRKLISDWYELRNDAAIPELLIYGYIGEWDDIDFVSFNLSIQEVKKVSNKVMLKIHSGGGSVIDGLAIYDALKTAGLEITVIVEGMAASMAGVLTQVAPKGNRRMNAHARLMVHRVKGGKWGNADDMRAYADLMDDMETRIKAIFVKTTGQAESVVNEWFTRNVDYWINAQDALKLGLIDEIIQGDAPANAFPANSLQELDEQQAYEALTNTLKNAQTQNKDMNKLQILITAALASRGVKLAENATEEQIANAVAQAFTELENKLNSKDEERADALVNALVASGKLKADDASAKKDVKDLAMVNYAMAVKFSEGLKPTDASPEAPKNVIVNVGTVPTNGGTPTNERDAWSFADWGQKDPAGLQALQNTDKAKFKALFKAEYGVEFEG